MDDRYPDQTLARFAKFAGCLRTAGMPDDFYQTVIDVPEFRDWLIKQYLCRINGVVRETPEQMLARTGMGRNFVGIQEAEKVFGQFTHEQKQVFANIPFSERTLCECSETHILVPDIGLSVFEMRDKVERLLDNPVWCEDERFFHVIGQPSWQLIRKSHVGNEIPDPAVSHIPTAQQVINAMILHSVVNGAILFEGYGVCTCDKDSHGLTVNVGWDKAKGVEINVGGASLLEGVLGLASARHI